MIDYLIYMKVVWLVPHILFSLSLVVVHNSSVMVILIPWMVSDLLLLSTVPVQLLSRLFKFISLSILVRMELFNPENNTNTILYLKNWTDVPYLLGIIILDVILFYHLSRIISKNILVAVTKTSRDFTVDGFGRITQSKVQRNKNSKEGAIDLPKEYLETPNSPSCRSNSSNTSYSVKRQMIPRFKSED